MSRREVGVWERDGDGSLGDGGWWVRMCEEVSMLATRTVWSLLVRGMVWRGNGVGSTDPRVLHLR